MANTKQHSFKIDCNKLKMLIQCTGKSVAKVSRDMGYSDSAVATALRSCRMSYDMSMRLDKLFKIKRNSYELLSTVDDIEVDTTEIIEHKDNYEELYNKLYQLIYAAVYEAVKKALAE